MVQNVSTVTVSSEKFLGALEQGNFGAHQGLNWEISHRSDRELSLGLVGSCAKKR
jgi:hypothetical protein